MEIYNLLEMVKYSTNYLDYILIIIFIANIILIFTWMFIIFILPILKIIELKNGKEPFLNRNLALFIFLLSFSISLKDHFKRTLIYAPSLDPYSVKVYPNDIFNVIRLSLQYDNSLFIVSILFNIFVFILIYRMKFFRKNNINIFWLLIFFLSSFVTVPFSIIGLKVEHAKGDILSNETIDEITEIREKWFCNQVFSSEHLFPAKSLGECRSTQG
ncbi:MAG: hypothetical protein KME40_21495 [Komarekiella atlantica HA4396-MV6]|jgi:hypothetical protein|nr:hypothetical protein [Komarekiella atlantica HA4396-MV6]